MKMWRIQTDLQTVTWDAIPLPLLSPEESSTHSKSLNAQKSHIQNNNKQKINNKWFFLSCDLENLSRSPELKWAYNLYPFLYVWCLKKKKDSRTEPFNPITDVGLCPLSSHFLNFKPTPCSHCRVQKLPNAAFKEKHMAVLILLNVNLQEHMM